MSRTRREFACLLAGTLGCAEPFVEGVPTGGAAAPASSGDDAAPPGPEPTRTPTSSAGPVSTSADDTMQNVSSDTSTSDPGPDPVSDGTTGTSLGDSGPGDDPSSGETTMAADTDTDSEPVDRCLAGGLPEGDPVVCSGDGDARTVEIVNECASTAIEVIWVNANCQEDSQVRFVVQPGAPLSIDTFAGHVWRIRASDGRLIQELEEFPAGRLHFPSGVVEALP